MDSVVSLAGRISSEIIRTYEESLGKGALHTPVTELNIKNGMENDSLEGVLS